jgi:hypothetical protein
LGFTTRLEAVFLVFFFAGGLIVTASSTFDLFKGAFLSDG